MSDQKLPMTFWLTLILLHHMSSETMSKLIDGSKMKNVISNIIENSLGATQFQEYIYKKNMIESSLDGKQLLDQFISATSNYLEGAFMAIGRLRTALEEDYRDNIYKRGLSRTDPRQCCLSDEDTFVWSNEFIKKIGTGKMCTRYSKDAAADSLIPFSERLLNTMKNNRNVHKIIKWQYFGSEEGAFVKFPQQKDKFCDTYDPRHRPWYAETAASSPKDIVIVFDRSGSIAKKGLLPMILNASATLIASLNVGDRIGMVAFNEDVYRPPGEKDRTCYYEQLAFATSENKAYLQTWLRGITGVSPSDYTKALSAAFEYFDDSLEVKDDSRARNRVIVFLSDGMQDFAVADDNGILQLISERNARLNNSVIIVTYGLGTDMSSEAENLLKNMSYQTKADPAAGPIQNGKFTRIKTSTNLRAKVGSYYNIFNNGYDDKPIIITPYADFSGLGLIISLCLPLRSATELQGVTCLDMSLTEIAKDIIDLQHGHNSYAFISDSRDHTVLHPLMPNPINYGTSLYLNIKELERDPGVPEILEKMKRGIPGKTSLMKKFVIPRGNTTTSGVTSVILNATYFWNQIQNGSFWITVVTTSSDKNITVADKALAAQRFIYHRLDFVDDIKKCSSHGRLSTKEHSVVKLTEDAFLKRYYYNGPDSKENVGIYTSYLESTNWQQHDKIKLITKQMIAISEYLEKIWIKLSEFDNLVMWRYYGDYNGHIRIYPGLTLPKEYDHTKRAFFLKAVYNHDLITLTPPYLDAFGAGVISSIVVPIFTQRNRAIILGVLGLDIKSKHIKYLVGKAFPVCTKEDTSCFLMDSSGYIVCHSERDYRAYKNGTDVYNYHITELEAIISKFLIKQGYLTKNECTDFGYKKKLHTWKVALDFSIDSYMTFPYFDMVRVHGTNLFLGIKNKNKEQITPKCSCPDRKAKDYGTRLYQCSADSCTCPCVKPAEYDYCKNEFENDGQLACVPQPRSIGFKRPIPNEKELVNQLQDCYQYDCADEVETECVLLEQCNWCSDTSKCVKGSCPPGPGSNSNTIIGAVLGVLVLIVIIVIVVIVARRKGACKGGTTPIPGNLNPNDMETESRPTSRYEISHVTPDVVQEKFDSTAMTSFEDIRIVGRDV